MEEVADSVAHVRVTKPLGIDGELQTVAAPLYFRRRTCRADEKARIEQAGVFACHIRLCAVVFEKRGKERPFHSQVAQQQLLLEDVHAVRLAGERDRDEGVGDPRAHIEHGTSCRAGRSRRSRCRWSRL